MSLLKLALKNCGFEIEVANDLADNNDEVPWYYPLTGEWRYVQSLSDLATFFRTSYLGRKVTNTMVSVMERVGIAPEGSVKVTEALENAAVGLVAGGKSKLFTPMMLFVAKKPEQPSQ